MGWKYAKYCSGLSRHGLSLSPISPNSFRGQSDHPHEIEPNVYCDAATTNSSSWTVSDVFDGSAGPRPSDAEIEIDQVYEQLSEAYDSLDANIIAPLYTEAALYLNADSEEGVRRGRENALRSFRDQFATAKERGSTFKMSFRIIDRAVEGNLAYDVGYYKFEAFPDKGDAFESAGKFVTVLRRGNDGQWRFHVDAFSGAPLTAFEEAEK